MAIPLYLAMTAAEFFSCTQLPPNPAWMSCRFSPSGKGLSNLPPSLPPGTLLILDDQTPPDGHDISLIRQQLAETMEANNCSGLLLDFQRPNAPQTARIAEELLSLPCPVCVSHLYAKDLSCPILLPPCPLTTELPEHLAPWDSREIWLEAATDSNLITVTENGSHFSPLPTDGDFPHKDTRLHCSYRIETGDNEIRFSLRRTRDDLRKLLEDAKSLGIQCAVGLWQEFTS